MLCHTKTLAPFAALAALTLSATIALAQPPQEGGGGIGMNIQAQRDKNKKVDPPTLNLKTEESATWPMIVTLLIVGASLLAAIIPSKRGHQD